MVLLITVFFTLPCPGKVRNDSHQKDYPTPPKSALWRSLFIPGWGQWANGQKLKGLIILGSEIMLFSGFYLQNQRYLDVVRKINTNSDPYLIYEKNYYYDDRNKFIWWTGGLHVANFLDAYEGGRQKIGAESGSPAAPAGMGSPRGALIRSMVFPGWGQWYNKKLAKGSLFFTFEGYLIYRIILSKVRYDEYHQKEMDFMDSVPIVSAYYGARKIEYEELLKKSSWWLVGTILVSMGDAYVDAHLLDFDTSGNLSFNLKLTDCPVISVSLRW